MIEKLIKALEVRDSLRHFVRVECMRSGLSFCATRADGVVFQRILTWREIDSANWNIIADNIRQVHEKVTI